MNIDDKVKYRDNTYRVVGKSSDRVQIVRKVKVDLERRSTQFISYFITVKKEYDRYKILKISTRLSTSNKDEFFITDEDGKKINLRVISKFINLKKLILKDEVFVIETLYVKESDVDIIKKKFTESDRFSGLF